MPCACARCVITAVSRYNSLFSTTPSFTTAIQPSSELIPIPGVDFVGTIPAEIQKVNTYAAAIVAGSKEMEASERLIKFLASEAATAAIQKNGMDPVTQP
jgi:ABC-type molybdate transport system substrate-binding protein